MSTIALWPILLKPDFVSNINFFCVFGDKGNEYIIVTNDNKIFSFGSNKYGCLGLGHNNPVQKPEIVEELIGLKIVDITYGLFHVLAITKCGKCFSWGYNFFGQLGIGTQINNNRPKLIKDLSHEKIVKISCGYNHSLVLTKNGRVYGFGLNSEGQIGCGNNENQLNPIMIIGFNNEKVVSIACGGCHSLALTDSGSVFRWGQNYFGQLRNGNNNKINPTKINLDIDIVIKSISCGPNHSLLLSTDGDIYAFGLNNLGQLGLGNQTDEWNAVRKVGTNKFEDIASPFSNNLSVAKSKDGFCYLWGESESKILLTQNKTDIKSMNEVFAKFAKIKITYQPFYPPKISCVTYSTNRLLNNITKLFNNQEYSDLTIKIENKDIYVHQFILKTNSNYFKSKLSENSRAIRESTDNRKIKNEILVTEYSYDVYYAFLKYLYTDSVDIENEKAMDLFVLANNYKEEDLKHKCIDIIKNCITLENVCSLFCGSIKYDLKEFENHCFGFAANKMNKIFKTEGFHKMDENSMKKFMEIAAKNNVFKQ